MKLKLFSVMSALCAMVLLGSCSKDDDGPALQSATYQLYNYSSGSPQVAGNFRIMEQRNGNAAIEINVDQAYRLPGTRFSAVIATFDETTEGQLVYANLGDVDGGAARAVINPVVELSTNRPIPYATLSARTGYSLRLLSGANVQATGIIQ